MWSFKVKTSLIENFQIQILSWTNKACWLNMKNKFLDLFCIDVSDDHGEAWYRSDSCQMIIILYHDEDDDHLMLMIMITIWDGNAGWHSASRLIALSTPRLAVNTAFSQPHSLALWRIARYSKALHFENDTQLRLWCAARSIIRHGIELLCTEFRFGFSRCCETETCFTSNYLVACQSSFNGAGCRRPD